MVISLVFIFEKLLWVVDIWIITVLNHPYFTECIRDVKEQRVDGSSNSMNLEYVRCTLVAGKPVFGRKIHYHSDNRIFVYSIFKKFIHTARSFINLWFITWFVEAEGCFI